MLKPHAVRHWAFLPILATGVFLRAQTGNGVIEGTVKDASGAVVPGAQVSITQKATAQTYRTKSNNAGLYFFPSAPLGNYDILIEAKGMQGWKGQLTLLAGQTAEVSSTLPVGSASQTVTVTGDAAPLVDTVNGTLGNVLEHERVEQLPLNGRNFVTLVGMTTPGIEGAGSGPSGFVWGIRYGTEFQQDGALLQDRYVGNTFTRPPGLDSIDEIESQTNSASAKVSRPGLVTVSTRAGTNQFHGSLFETARNNGLGLARARTDYYTKPPQLIRNEFGGSIGGPVWIPKLYNGKDKTFFFFNYETRRNIASATTQIAVPTAAMRQGNFSGLIDSNGHPNTIYDPLTSTPTGSRSPFPNQQIPISRESPVAKALFAITPLPTLPNVNPLAGDNWYGTAPNDTREYTYTMRFDHQFTDRDHVFVRFTRGNNSNILQTAQSNDGSPVTLDGQDNVNVVLEHNYTGVVSYSHTFSPTFFSETVGTYLYEYTGNRGVNANQNVAASLGLPNPFGGGGTPFIINTGTPFISASSVSWMSYYTPYETLSASRVGSLDQNFTKIKGRHELLFGLRLRQEGLSQLPNQQYAAGEESFASMATALIDPSSGNAYNALPYTGNNTANLFLGVAANYTAQFNRSYNRLSAAERSGYFQDNFKVNSCLTLNLGLRYEYFSPFQANDGGITGFDPSNLSIVLGAPVSYLIHAGDTVPSIVNGLQSLGASFENNQQAGLPSSLVHNYAKNFGWRAGFAYRATRGNHPLVIRAGYALYAFPEALRTATTYLRVAVPTTGTFTLNQNSSAQSPDGQNNYLLRAAPTIIAGVNSAKVVDVNSPSNLVRGSQLVYYFNPNQPTSRAAEWNFTVEKEIGLQTLVSAGYIGTHGYNLGQYVNTNDSTTTYNYYLTTGQPLPTGSYSGVVERPLYTGPTGPGSVLGAVSQLNKIGWSNANGIQLQIEHRFSNGVGFQAFYVLTNGFRAGGNGWSDDTIEASPKYFLPGSTPPLSNLRALDRLEFYSRDPEFPKHHFQYNWIYNVPVGRGKRFGGNMGRALDAVAGGWQLVGNGSIASTYFALPMTNWGSFSKPQIYGTKFPIQDCRSGTCYIGYLWWDGYIPSSQINTHNDSGRCIGVCGVPTNYAPSDTPIVTDATSPYYNTNTVFIRLANGQTVSTLKDTGLNPWQNQYAPGPLTWGLNGSLWKVFNITERANLQFHADFFNILNMPGLVAPSTDGTLLRKNSLNTPRNLQLSLRLVW